jgi:hypothetical protein
VQQQIVGRHKRKKSSTPAKLSRHDQKEEGGARVWEGGSHTHHDTSKANEIAAK